MVDEEVAFARVARRAELGRRGDASARELVELIGSAFDDHDAPCAEVEAERRWTGRRPPIS